MALSEIPPLPVDDEALALLTPTERWLVKRVLALQADLNQMTTILEKTTQILETQQVALGRASVPSRGYLVETERQGRWHDPSDPGVVHAMEATRLERYRGPMSDPGAPQALAAGTSLSEPLVEPAWARTRAVLGGLPKVALSPLAGNPLHWTGGLGRRGGSGDSL